MNDTPASHSKRDIPAWIKVLFILTLLLGMATVIWQQLPRSGISTDLDLVGQGTPVLVLTRDVFVVGGAEVMAMLAELEEDYQAQVVFRIAHQGQPEGQAFARQHNTQDADLTLLDGQGEVLGSLVQPDNSAAIRAFLDRLL